MSKGHRLIDSDSHILEPPDLFEKYLEPKFRSHMPRAWVDYQGDPLGFGISVTVPSAHDQEYVMPFGSDPVREGRPTFGDAGTRIVLPEHDDAYASFAREGFPPEHYDLGPGASGH